MTIDLSWNTGMAACALDSQFTNCVIKHHTGRCVMVWESLEYHDRSQLLEIVGNLNRNRYIRNDLEPEVLPFLQCIP